LITLLITLLRSLLRIRHGFPPRECSLYQ
jgi:hypothetical protein